MKEQFTHRIFKKKSEQLLGKILAITEQYMEAGYRLSLRQLFYLLTGTGVIQKTEQTYTNLGNLVSQGRLAGVIDWDAICDRNRSTSIAPHCEDIKEIIQSAKYGYAVDMWARQSNYVEVFCEKQSLEGVLEPVCSELDIPFSSNKGYSSSSAYYDASKRYLRAALDDKQLHVLYFGDHDPSGIDMTRDIDDRLNLFLSTPLENTIFSEEELASIDPRPHEVHRLALNMDQVNSMHLQSAPGKIKDSRFEAYKARFGSHVGELAAIEPRVLAKLVRDAVEGLIDRKRWDEDKAREEKAREELQRFADTYGQEQTTPAPVAEPEKPFNISDYTREERPNEPK